MNHGKNQSVKILFIFSALLSFFVFAVPEVSAEFYVIAGSRGVGTEIKSLPYTISSPGFYYITKDLSCAAGVHGITITADNVTVDLMGFSLVGPGGTGYFDGIYMWGRTNVEIRNGTVRQFQHYGIGDCSSLGTSHRIINIRVRNNGDPGIYLLGKSHLVKDCTAMENGDHGIYAGSGSTVTGNTCYNNDNVGITTNGSATVTGNTCYNNDRIGIFAGAGSTVTGNTCYDNRDHGILAGAGSTVTDNTCRSNTDHGIYLCGNNFVDRNTATSNAGGNMNAPASCTIRDNHTPE